MRIHVVGTVIALILACFPAAVEAETPRPTSPIGLEAARATVGRFASSFVENRGQAHPSVRFYGERVSLTTRGLVFDLGERVALEFVGADPGVKPVGRVAVGAATSIFRGSPDDWKTGIRRFGEVSYPNLWPGVDLVVRSGEGGLLKYEFVVAPGADLRAVRLAYRSVERAGLTESGEIEVRTADGLMREKAPVSYQEIDGTRVPVSSAFRAARDSHDFEYGFAVGAYDRSRPLVVDPDIVFSGLLGGGEVEHAADVAVDANGDIYIAGSIASAPADGFPVVAGPRVERYAEDIVDAFVAKISSDGARLIYCGYIGGTRLDYATSVAVDSQGNAYVYGTTFSKPDVDLFPVVVGPHLQLNQNATYRFQDVFISKVSADGTRLLYCGYVNMQGHEDSEDVAVGPDGSAYIAAKSSTSLRVVPNVPRPPFNQCEEFEPQAPAEGILVKVKPDGSGIDFQTWIAGPGLDYITGVAVDSSGSVYVTGMTTSSTLVCFLKNGPKLTSSGRAEAFVGKLKPDLRSFEYLGFIGGAGVDYGTRVAVDASGAVYVVGFTSSTQSSFPVSGGPDLTHNGPEGTFDAFIAKVKPDGTGLVYCGYIGGAADDTATGVAVDSRGRAYVTGTTASTEASFPLVDAIDGTWNGGTGVGDAFVARVAANGGSLDFATYLGGTNRDAGLAIALDPQGRAVVVGVTQSQDGSFPTANAFNTTPKGLTDVFVTKLSFGPAGPAPPSVTGAVKEGKFLVVTGASFVAGAKVLVNGTAYKAKFTSATSVKSKKAGKNVQPGDRVRVRNPDGQESNEIVYETQNRPR